MRVVVFAAGLTLLTGCGASMAESGGDLGSATCAAPPPARGSNYKPNDAPLPAQAFSDPAPAPVLTAADEDVKPRPRLTRTLTLGANNDQPVFEGPPRGDGSPAPSDPYATTFRYSPYYTHAQTYTVYSGYGAYFPRTFRSYHAPVYSYEYGHSRRPSQGPAVTPPVGGDWPRAPIGGGATYSAPPAPVFSPSLGSGPAVGAGGVVGRGGTSAGVVR